MMYEQFGKAGKGYSEEDYRLLVEEVANESLHTIFDNHLHGTSDYMPSLEHYLLLAGLEIKKVPATKTTERMFGFGTDEAGGKAVVALVQPESPADKAQLWTGDEIVTINGVAPYKNFQHLMAEGATKPLELAIMRKGQMMTKTIHASVQPVMWKYSLQQVAQPSAKQEALLKAWKKRRL
jgi:predicted metalloprotease with PDZ domain